jgi:hypothetical protein
MAAIHSAPTLGYSRVTHRARVTVPGEVASWSCRCPQRPCPGFRPLDLPQANRDLELAILDVGHRWTERIRLQGFELLGPITVHGPFVSQFSDDQIVDVESPMWEEARRKNDPSLVLGAVVDRKFNDPYAEYLLMAHFVARDVLVEVPEKEQR